MGRFDWLAEVLLGWSVGHAGICAALSFTEKKICEIGF